MRKDLDLKSPTSLKASTFTSILVFYQKWWTPIFEEHLSLATYVLRKLHGESGQSIYIVGNKAKGQISKRVLQENNARQIFRKTNIFYPLIRTSGTLGCESSFAFPFFVGLSSQKKYVCVSRVRNVCALENLTWFLSL